jgi:hypothetical protein
MTSHLCLLPPRSPKRRERLVIPSVPTVGSHMHPWHSSPTFSVRRFILTKQWLSTAHEGGEGADEFSCLLSVFPLIFRKDFFPARITEALGGYHA